MSCLTNYRCFSIKIPRICNQGSKHFEYPRKYDPNLGARILSQCRIQTLSVRNQNK